MTHIADEPFERAVTRLKGALGERSLVTIDDLRRALEAGVGHLLTTQQSVIFVSVDDHLRAGERVVNVGPAAGNLEEIMEALPHLEDWARQEGCSQVQVHGRRGWVRALRGHGYDEYQTTVRKLLD